MLSAGTILGPYEILESIGAGGMGEVYRARDGRVGRTVAIKISKDQFSERFEREARAIASLNHPNIAQLFDVGASPSGFGYLVMEYVEGSTIAEMIQHGPLPPEEAIHVARQIAEALEEAHEKNIVHRDLKPANIKVTPEGRVKVLDFGLAKTLDDRVAPASGNPSDSPTMTLGMTVMGTILGTAAYMAPEQARGKAVDKRADIWAFGATLFEIFSGKRAFDGEDSTEILAAVVKLEPDYSALPASVPLNVRRLIQHCLVKDRRNRLREITDARIELSHPIEAGRAAQVKEVRVEVPVEVPVKTPTRVGWAAAVVAALVAIGLATVHFREKPASLPVVRTSILPPEAGSGFVLAANTGGSAISPDGRLLAFVVLAGRTPMLFVRPLDSLTARPLPGTENASRPFWSTDSRNIGFQAAGKLKRIGVNEGAPRVICDLAGARGATWNADGVILFATRDANALSRVSAAGGTPQPVTKRDEKTEQYHYWPQFLPDGKRFLYVIRANPLEKSAVYLGDLDDKPDATKRVKVVDSQYGAVYAPDPADPTKGHLLWVQGTNLMVQSFDPSTLKFNGEAEPVTQSIGGTASNGYVDISVSRTGVLAYGNSTQGNAKLVWIDRSGKKSAPLADASLDRVRLSPDGNSVLVSRVGSGSSDLWLTDLVRSTQTRLTFAGGSNAAWSPDGKEVLYSGPSGLFRKPASGSGEPVQVLTASGIGYLDWSPDGKYILYGAGAQESWVVPVEPGSKVGKPFLFLKGIGGGQFSRQPSGQLWFTYGSSESGQRQVYIQDFPDKHAKYQVSTDEGFYPIFSRDGKEIFFQAGQKMMSVSIKTASDRALILGRPEPLFDLPQRDLPYDVHPDGKRFLMLVSEADRGGDSITLVEHWQSALGK